MQKMQCTPFLTHTRTRIYIIAAIQQEYLGRSISSTFTVMVFACRFICFLVS
jgi:hypothetical protein